MMEIEATGTREAGKLIYLIGASGAGKDTVLGYIQKNNPVKNTLVAHRYVARSNGAEKCYENQVSLTFDEFDSRRENGFFTLYWQAHDAIYGIGIEVDRLLQAGINVLVNGSREYFPKVLEKYPDAIIVGLTVNQAVLTERLINRGRESEREIQKRVLRNQQLSGSFPNNCATIDNSGSVEDAITQLQTILASHCGRD